MAPNKMPDKNESWTRSKTNLGLEDNMSTPLSEYDELLEQLHQRAEIDEDENTVTIKHDLVDFAKRVSDMKWRNAALDDRKATQEDIEEYHRYRTIWEQNCERDSDIGGKR